MLVWWLLGGIGAFEAVIVLYRKWLAKHPSVEVPRHIMTKTVDGEPLQFLVRGTRSTRGKARR